MSESRTYRKFKMQLIVVISLPLFHEAASNAWRSNQQIFRMFENN